MSLSRSELMDAIWSVSKEDLTDTQKHILLCFAWHADTNGLSNVSRNTVVKLTGLSICSVHTITRGLQAKGILNLKTKGRTNHPSVYSFDLSKVKK